MNRGNILLRRTGNRLMRRTALFREGLVKVISRRIRSLEDGLSGPVRADRPEAFQEVDLFGFVAHFGTTKSEDCGGEAYESIGVGEVWAYVFKHGVDLCLFRNLCFG